MYDHVDYLYNKTKMSLVKTENVENSGYAYGSIVRFYYRFDQIRAKVTGSGKLLWIPIDNDFSRETSGGSISSETLNCYHEFLIDGKIKFIPENHFYYYSYDRGANGRSFYRTTDKWIYFNKSIEVFYYGSYGTYNGKYNTDIERYGSMNTDYYNKTVGKYLVYWNG